MQNQTPPKNKQDVLNRVWQHFIVEKHDQCSTVRDSNIPKCVYRNNGNGCAVGCMMPDAMAKKCDNTGDHGTTLDIFGILERFDDVQEWFKNVERGFLKSLQVSHDMYFQDFKEQLESIAARNGLTIPKQ